MGNSIKAYHGSDAKISKFTLDKLKTGVGNNVYGLGIYFSNNPNMVRGYGEFTYEVTINQMDTVKVYDDLVPKEIMIMTLKTLMTNNQIDDETAKGFLEEIKTGSGITYLTLQKFLDETIGTMGAIDMFVKSGINGLKVPDETVNKEGEIYAIINPNLIVINGVRPNNHHQESIMTKSLRQQLRETLLQKLVVGVPGVDAVGCNRKKRRVRRSN